MKKLTIFAAFAWFAMLAPAMAQTTGTVEWWLHAVDGPDVSGPYTTQTLCRDAARALNQTKTWDCDDRYKTVNFPKPPAETQTVQCVAPLIGTWMQARAYSWNGTKWVAGAWTPTTAPTGSCAPPPKPADDVQTIQCPSGTAGTWQQSRIYTWNGTAWVAGAWTPSTAPAGVCTAKPVDLTRVVQCAPPLTGSWTQTAAFTFSGTTWVQGPWLPTAAPAGACTAPPTGETVTNWVTVATEQFPDFTTNGPARIGHPSKGWIVGTVNGAGRCDANMFHGAPNPALGLYVQCQVPVSAPNVVQTGAMPVINVPLLPPPQRGYSTEKIVNSGGGFEPGGADLTESGAFRTNCGVSHFAFDDPIVFPGQAGKSHLHMFFGNTGANAYTTKDNITTTGDSTCSGGILNRTGYWVPAMVNLKTGAPVAPSGSSWYYKSAYRGVRAADVKPFPAGLRMIAGESGRTVARTDDMIRFGCASTSLVARSIPDCAVGDQVTIGIVFPQCWDGVNIDSPDHKSHMAYASGGCPASHPVALAEVALNISFTVTEARPDLNWKLSSDNYPSAGAQHGYSFHADWFNGWRDDIMKTFVTKCINTRASSSNSLCDDRYLSD